MDRVRYREVKMNPDNHVNPVKPTIGQRQASHFYRITGLAWIYMIPRNDVVI